MPIALVTQVLSSPTIDHSLLNLALRAALSCIFLISGTGKAWDLPGTRQALSDFGMPDALTSRGSKCLPAVEIVLGFGLVFDLTYRFAAGGAAVLSLLFVLGLANLLRQGRTPPCHCFGAIHSGPVGPATLLRAALLLSASLACFGQEASKLTPDTTACVLAGGGAFFVVSAATNVALWKRLQRGLHEAVALGVGQRLPALRLFNDRWLNDVLPTKQRSLILVTSPGCGSCKEVASHLDRWRKAVAGELAIVELQAHSRPEETNPATADTYGFSNTELERFVRGTPSGFLVDPNGFLLSPPVIGSEQIETLLRVAVLPRV